MQKLPQYIFMQFSYVNTRPTDTQNELFHWPAYPVHNQQWKEQQMNDQPCFFSKRILVN